jgi:hypothetical protein
MASSPKIGKGEEWLILEVGERDNEMSAVGPCRRYRDCPYEDVEEGGKNDDDDDESSLGMVGRLWLMSVKKSSFSGVGLRVLTLLR